MNDSSDHESTAKTRWLSVLGARLLNFVERLGNRLPDPLVLFILLALATPLISWIVAQTGWTLAHPATGEPIRAVNLLAPAQLQRMFTEAVANFVNFPPLGTVLVTMMGIGIAERSGLISAWLKMLVTAVPRSVITGTLVFAGIMSSMAVDAGYVMLTPLGAVLFDRLGRHPIAGLCAAFAGVSAGFSANLLLTSLDPLLAGFTQSAARLYDPAYEVFPSANYFFMVASVFLLTLVGWWVTEKIVEPRLGKWEGAGAVAESHEADSLPAGERRAAMVALVVMALAVAFFFGLTYPAGAILRGDDGGLAPFYKSLVPIIAIVFVVPGLVFGWLTRTIQNSHDVARMTGDTMATMGAYIVLAFAAAQFVAWFGWSNLGFMMALAGAETLKAIGLGDIALLGGLLVLSASVNLFIGSASAKWALMAPVLVPMCMGLGLSPELAQAAYRVGDSVTNIITPLMPYFPIIIAFARKYNPDIRLGTLIASMLPYSIAFAVSWAALFILWFVFQLPLGPDAPLRYAP